MASTVFTGPVLAGNVLNSDGSGNLAGIGGSSGTQNVGFANMVQFSTVSGVVNANLTQVTNAVATNIVIPAQSIITDIYVYVTASFTNAGTLSIGTSTAATELATGVSCSQGQVTVAPTTTVAAWLSPAASQDVMIYVKSSAAGTGTFVVAVAYAQAINGFTNGQYT